MKLLSAEIIAPGKSAPPENQVILNCPSAFYLSLVGHHRVISRKNGAKFGSGNHRQ